MIMFSLEERLSALTSPEINNGQRYYENYDELRSVVERLQQHGKQVVLTQGVYDLLHIGHAQYLKRAREHGDVLIVGVDSDELTRARKGEGRPIVPQEERITMLLHLRHVDIVVLRHTDAHLEHLIERVRPDVLVTSKSTTDLPTDNRFAEHCGRVCMLDPQATTSTSARIRTVSMVGADQLANELSERIPEVVSSVLEKLKKT